MGCYKLGAECCNNCIHWDAERDDKHGKENVYSYKNCAKCTSSHSPQKGRTTLAENVCQYFSHVWGISKTFSLSEAKGTSTTGAGNTTASGMDSLTSAYVNGLMEDIKASAARKAQAQREAQRAKEQERREAQRARDARKMEILIKNGMDPNASSDEQFQFELMCTAASPDDADSLCEIGEACFTGTFGAKEDPEKGVKYFEKAARMGLAKAQYMLGCAYWTGEGVEKSELRAFQWFQDAAKQGYAEAQYRLGMCYVRGFHTLGTTKIVNVMEGLPWLKKASENGYEKAAEAIKEAVRKLDKEDAFEWYCKQAKAGDAEAQNMAGRHCQMGWGCDVDFEKALMFFSKAAEQNDLAALNNLAVMYENGQGCQKDVKKARELFAKAVAGDFSRAAYHLGRFYENGIGGDRNISEAVKLYSKAADDGDADALVALAEIYLKGNDDVEQDMGKAVELLEEAADNKERPSAKSRAKALLGECYENGWGVEEDEDEDGDYGAVEAGYLYEEAAKDEKCALGCYNYARYLEEGLGVVDQDREKALYYYRKAAEQEYVKAYCKIGDFYLHGWAVEKDEKEAFKWYRKAAEQNDPQGQNRVGFCYIKGCGGVEKDHNKAFEWRMKAAEQGYALAQVNVGTHYLNGTGCERDYAKAMLWFEKADKQGHAAGSAKLGFCYEKGLGCTPDPVKAVYYYKKAAEQKDSTACNNLALMYENGNAVEKDLKKAYDLFVIAARRGSARSCYHLGRFYENGLAVQADRAKAKEWYSKAAAKGDKDAKAALERLG